MKWRRKKSRTCRELKPPSGEYPWIILDQLSESVRKIKGRLQFILELPDMSFFYVMGIWLKNFKPSKSFKLDRLKHSFFLSPWNLRPARKSPSLSSDQSPQINSKFEQ